MLPLKTIINWWSNLEQRYFFKVSKFKHFKLISKKNFPPFPYSPLRANLSLGLTMEVLSSSPLHTDITISALVLKHLFPEGEFEMWKIVCCIVFSCFLFCKKIQNSLHHSAIQDCTPHASKYSGDVSTHSISVKGSEQEKQSGSESTASLVPSWELDLVFGLKRYNCVLCRT